MIEILLSTFNGEKYLCALLDSLLNQTYQDFIIIIRDDGSSDHTCDIIESYYTEHQSKIIYIKDSMGNTGSTRSFSALLAYSNAKYIMFCDQDDIWLPTKIELTYNAMQELEIEHPEVPLLVYTDLIEVKQNLEITSSSFMKSHRLYPNKIRNASAMLAMSVAAGCTIMINKKSIKFILPIPSFLVHDHWIATNISHYGYCVFLNIQTILYRQHSNNSVGTKHVNFKYLINRLGKTITLCHFFVTEIKSYPFKINISSFLFYKIKFNIYRLINL